MPDPPPTNVDDILAKLPEARRKAIMDAADVEHAAVIREAAEDFLDLDDDERRLVAGPLPDEPAFNAETREAIEEIRRMPDPPPSLVDEARKRLAELRAAGDGGAVELTPIEDRLDELVASSKRTEKLIDLFRCDFQEFADWFQDALALLHRLPPPAPPPSEGTPDV